MRQRTFQYDWNVRCFFYLLFPHYPLTKHILRDTMYYARGGMLMDMQLKRGMLDVCVLAAIKNEDS